MLVLDGGQGIAVGADAHTKHRFRIGDEIEGSGLPIPDRRKEWAKLYRVSGLKIRSRGPEFPRPA